MSNKIVNKNDSKKINVKDFFAKKRIVAIGFGLVILCVIVCMNIFGTDKTKALEELESSDAFNSDTMEFQGYVTKGKNSAKKNFVKTYIPISRVNTYENTVQKGKTYQVVETVSIGEDGIVNYEDKEDLLGETVTGVYETVDNDGDTLISKVYDDTKKTLIITPGSKYDITERTVLESLTNTYTVKVKAGTFENCICMVTTDMPQEESELSSGTTYTISYYAPTVGLVLEVVNSDFTEQTFGSKYAITRELVNTQK